MLAALFELLIFCLMVPALIVFALFKMVADIAAYFGFWLFPGVFGLCMGINLSMVAPSDPDVPFESMVQVIAGSHIAGFETPSVLILIGIASLLVPPACSLFKLMFRSTRNAK
ncbi:hypothetical protein GIW79_22945 [Pseudomonas sp. PA-7-1E]|jgi:hypothetical protein|uniref:hypothetical protein n=1 Tax=Gammaproteobacteria TaxID=1236 RepID=UPI0019346C90|nr:MULTISPECIES: hypothetical protein [Gammaproteobacteria]HCR3985120.1 hypothetical protein [Kluyvera ascorbata]EIE9938010.1 hypothetical protein [Escherichia coli]MBM0557848.1 hypothetical protein [Escherichia coli]MCF4988325.1 hypothetical protein [Pseudomonas gessardii]MCF5043310.1 hypothetical protein [Pseudomonas sp. PA-7-1E]